MKMILIKSSNAFWCILITMIITSCQTNNSDNAENADIDLDTLESKNTPGISGHTNPSINAKDVDLEIISPEPNTISGLYSLIIDKSNEQNELSFKIIKGAYESEDYKYLNQVPDSIVSVIFPEFELNNKYVSYRVFHYSHLPLIIRNGTFLIERIYDNNPEYMLILVLLDDQDKVISQSMVANNNSYSGGYEESASHFASDTIVTYSISGFPKEHPDKTGSWYSVYDSITTQSQILEDGRVVPLPYYDSVRIDNPPN